jgi:hypothetical protein
MHDTFATTIAVTHCITAVNISFFSDSVSLLITHTYARTRTH